MFQSFFPFLRKLAIETLRADLKKQSSKINEMKTKNVNRGRVRNGETVGDCLPQRLPLTLIDVTKVPPSMAFVSFAIFEKFKICILVFLNVGTFHSSAIFMLLLFRTFKHSKVFKQASKDQFRKCLPSIHCFHRR